ncbi:unnamed protein product [Enterobius vermicularis]|uniref:SMP-LTD domain-containing protein n=1 Tax=Enterobius vermicularis TaxID=51028 RepID=A0A0N4V1C2_ENTVE|nr:unnamed protein product [Enterobius vermicularis]
MQNGKTLFFKISLHLTTKFQYLHLQKFCGIKFILENYFSGFFRFYKLPFFQYRLTVFVVLLGLTYMSSGFLIGLLWGLYISVVSFLFFFVSEPFPKATERPFPDPSVSEESHACGTTVYKNQGKFFFKGWMNELRGRYDSATYHVNSTQTVLVRLHGNILRISRPERAVLKHTFHVDPTLTEPEPTIVGHSIYDLTGAKVSLRPKRLAARRWWSRKYPIHIRLPSTRSELSTIDSVMHRSHSFQQGNRFADPSLGKMVFYDSMKEDGNVSDFTGSAQFIKDNRSNSTGDLGDFSETTEFKRHSKTKSCGTSLFLFVRSAREKERWFHRFVFSIYRLYKTCIFFTGISFFAGYAKPPNFVHLMLFYFLCFELSIFCRAMSEVLPDVHHDRETKDFENVVCMDLGRLKWHKGTPAGKELVLTANPVFRIFFDFCRDTYWCNQVKNKIQSKLATIHLPYFIETLELSNLDLGNVTPEIASVYSPSLDEWGLWVDFELKYHGRIHLVLETRVNLMKLRDGFQRVDTSKLTSSIRVHHYSDEDLPESPESSPDEDFGAAPPAKERTGKKILSIVDKIASSKYFQGASQLKPVKKMMEGISSTRLMLNVYVTCVEGTMTLNLPPPPSDRLWYAFRHPPTLSIRAVPQFGDRSVDLSTISDWIESKLRLLIEKFLVCPNMDDIIVPVMSGNRLLKSGYNQ